MTGKEAILVFVADPDYRNIRQLRPAAGGLMGYWDPMQALIIKLRAPTVDLAALARLAAHQAGIGGWRDYGAYLCGYLFVVMQAP